MPLAPGQILNQRYRIIRLLGQGGFGAVYHAWDANLERTCAIKENLDTTEEAQRQFRREAVILANLSHPNLPHVSDHFIIPGQGQYLVMDYVEGNDLRQMLERSAGPLPESQVLDWIGQVCDAIFYLHSQQPPVIHRDIKPANIKITPQGKAVLVDFGIAKIYDPSKHTTIGAKAVTPGYSPPEQYGGSSSDARADIYALGATTYHLLTGQSPTESVNRLAGRPLVEPRGFNPAVSPQTNYAVMRALDLDPARRYASAADFKTALRTIHAQELVQPGPQYPRAFVAPPEAAPLGPTVPASPAPARRTLPSWLPWALLLLVVCGVIGGIGGVFAMLLIPVNPPVETETPTALWTTTNTPLPASPTPSLTHTIIPTSSPTSTDTPPPPSATPSPLPSLTFTPPPVQLPQAYNFMACPSNCRQDGSNATRVFPEGTTKLYLQWSYANVPVGAHYVRRWSMQGNEWVRYDCTWPGPINGTDTITLTEPDGLHSGSWEVTITVNEVVILREQIEVLGNWTYWSPAGTFLTCYGKK
jgi:serine/threonine protein kinase